MPLRTCRDPGPIVGRMEVALHACSVAQVNTYTKSGFSSLQVYFRDCAAWLLHAAFMFMQTDHMDASYGVCCGTACQQNHSLPRLYMRACLGCSGTANVTKHVLLTLPVSRSRGQPPLSHCDSLLASCHSLMHFPLPGQGELS